VKCWERGGASEGYIKHATGEGGGDSSLKRKQKEKNVAIKVGEETWTIKGWTSGLIRQIRESERSVVVSARN